MFVSLLHLPVECNRDASSSGWGVISRICWYLGVWLRQEQEDHIYNLKMEAVMNALFVFQDKLFSRSAIFILDNASLLVHLNKQWETALMSLCQWTQVILLWTESQVHATFHG